LVFIFPNIIAVYILNPNTRESLTLLKAIFAAGDAVPAMLILPGVIIAKGEFDNNINNNVLFRRNLETNSGYSNDKLAINWLEYFERTTRPKIKTHYRTIYNSK
jgi:hypothetical protein